VENSLCFDPHAGMAHVHLLSTWFIVNGKPRGKKNPQGSPLAPKRFLNRFPKAGNLVFLLDCATVGWRGRAASSGMGNEDRSTDEQHQPSQCPRCSIHWNLHQSRGGAERERAGRERNRGSGQITTNRGSMCSVEGEAGVRQVRWSTHNYTRA